MGVVASGPNLSWSLEPFMYTFSPSPRALWAALALILGLAAAGCAGPQKPNDPLAQGLRPHLAQLAPDAEMILTLRDPRARAEAIQSTRAWEKLRAALTQGTPDSEITELFSKLDALSAVMGEHLRGRLTLSLHNTPAVPGSSQTEEEYLIIVDGDVDKLVQGIEALDDLAPGPRSHLGGDIYQYRAADSEGEPLFLFQRGPTGYLASRAELLTELQGRWLQKEAAALQSEALFQETTRDVDADAEVLLWLRDWTSADEDWSGLLGATAPQAAPTPRPMVLTADLTGGVDARMVVTVDDDFLQDPEIADILPSLAEIDGPPQIPALLPPQVVGYAGLSLSLGALEQMLDEADSAVAQEMMPGDAAGQMLAMLLRELSGEFALIITEAEPTRAPSLMLGFPLPEVALVARLKNGQSAATLKPALVQIFGWMAQLEGGGLLQAGQTQQIEGVEAVVHATVDPTLQLAYAFHPDHHLLLGTPGAIAAILKQRGLPSAQSLAQGSGHAAVTALMGDASNYRLHLDLAALYRWASVQFQAPLSIMSQGALGGAEDPVAELLQVFRFAGGSLTYKDQRLWARMYLTARDL